MRDYSHLPERLRPPNTLDFSKIDSHVLTSYAGLLFRDLLDRCGGYVAATCVNCLLSPRSALLMVVEEWIGFRREAGNPLEAQPAAA